MVVIFLGSASDLNWGREIIRHLDELGVKSRYHLASAHKTPEHLLRLLKSYEKESKIVYIAVAGKSNALGGLIDAHTRFPVINCPPFSEKYAGLDVLSSLRMPSGVCPLTVLEPEQAALAAAKILALADKKFSQRIILYQRKMKEKILWAEKKLHPEEKSQA